MKKKFTYKNGSSIAFCGTGDPEAGRGLRPFEPHPCQMDEIIVKDIVAGNSLLSKFFRLKKLDIEYSIAKSKEDINKMHDLLDEKMELLGMYPPEEDQSNEL